MRFTNLALAVIAQVALNAHVYAEVNSMKDGVRRSRLRSGRRLKTRADDFENEVAIEAAVAGAIEETLKEDRKL